MKLWSPGRVKAYKVALQQKTPLTLAILRIPRLDLEVPVYDGTTDAVLDLAAGRMVHGTARDDGQRWHRGSPRRLLPGAEGHQGRGPTGARYTCRDRAIPGRVDPDHHAGRRQRDRSDARSRGDAGRLLPVLPLGSSPAAVYRARSARGRIAPRLADVRAAGRLKLVQGTPVRHASSFLRIAASAAGGRSRGRLRRNSGESSAFCSVTCMPYWRWPGRAAACSPHSTITASISSSAQPASRRVSRVCSPAAARGGQPPAGSRTF